MKPSSPSPDRPSSPSPAGRATPAADEALLLDTIAVFQPHTAERLTVEDAQEIVDDVAAFLSLLAEWDAERADTVAATTREVG